ncbi:MAG: hypothetical protein PSV24_00900 [Rhodoferax sp.]|nr:hypothetical protein [Rhodoferax sp.]
MALIAFSSNALSLGELQGNALIGQPLDLIVSVQTSQTEELSEGCVRADIYYGEARQNAPRITTKAGQLRLQISAPVNEPVVTVQIRNFCGVSQMRNYVLLADLPSDFTASVATTALATAAQPGLSSAELAPTAVVLPQGTVAKSAKSSSPTPRKAAPFAAKTIKAVKAKKPKKSTSQRTRERKKISAQAVKSVLKLDPTEILSDRMDTLELNMPFAPAADALLQSRQIATLQADVKSMRELAVKNDRALLELQSQLQQAQSQQQLTTLFYALIALLLLGLASLFWLWQRQKKLTLAAQSWWQRPTDDDLTAFLNPDGSGQAAKPSKAVAPSIASPVDAALAQRPDQADPLILQEANIDAIEKVQANAELVVASVPLTINHEAVQDIRQQADFFISLGQPHRAIEILNQHIATADAPNPLICMDLLGLYQQAKQTAEFDQLCDVCQQHFNVKLTDLVTFQHAGQDLMHYPVVLTKLTRLWPGEQAQAFLDSCIFLTTGSKAKTAFDLAAFRDLLTLHIVAEELAASVTPSPNVQARQADQVTAPLDRPLDALDVFPSWEPPKRKSGIQATEAPAGNLPGLDFVLPQDPPPNKR